MKKRKNICNTYENAILPPCANFLNNANPLVKDNTYIYRNYNSLYCFIATNPLNSTQNSNSIQVYTNLQISLYNYIIGLFINEIQLKKIKYDENLEIHSDKSTNKFIHGTLKSNLELKANFIPYLSLIISNSYSIVSLYTKNIPITPLNYYILFVLNRLEGQPGLFFGNNSYTTPDIINFNLAALNIKFPYMNPKKK